MRKIIFVSCAVALVGMQWGMGAALAETPVRKTNASYQLDIPSQSLNDALQALALASKHELLYPAKLVDGMSSVALRGSFTTEEAVKLLLVGTDLEYDLTPEGLVVIRAKGEPSPISSISSVTEAAGNNSTLRLARAAGETSPGSAEGTGDVAHETKKEEAFGLEEIVVTAQKRKERLKDVPISMSVMTGEALDKSTYSALDDALRTVPGIVMHSEGQTGMTKIAIRGVTSNPSLFNGSSTTGFYVDETPFAFVRFPYTPNVGSIYDLEQVEVLRGPQGTLYGANSLNGVIRVKTRDANLDQLEFKGRSKLSYTNDGQENYGGDVAMNIPVVPGKLAIRGVVGYAEDNGWVDRSVAPFDEDINDQRQKNLRFKVNAAPIDNLGVELMAWLSRTDVDARSESQDDRKTPVPIALPEENGFDAYNLTLTYDFAGMAFTSATTHMTYAMVARGYANFDAVVTPEDTFNTDLGSTLTSQEFRLVSTDEGAWRWSMGGVYREEKDTHRFQINSPGVDLVLPQFSGQELNEYTAESFAIFGEVTRTLTNRLDLTVGLRYFEDETAIKDITAITPGSPLFGRRSEQSSALTGRVVLQFRATDAVNVYASYGQGFRPGFTQGITILKVVPTAPAGVKPDRLNNYEVGSKGALFDGRLAYDVAAYYVDWNDTVQVYPTLFISPSATIQADAAVNSEGITGPGLDATVNFQVTEGLTLSGNVSWNNLQFVDDVVSGAAGNPVVIRKGSRPDGSAKLMASAGLDYTFPLLGQYTGRLNSLVSYMSALTGPGIVAAPSGNKLTPVRAAFTVEAPANWTATLFADNLTDEDGRIRPGALDSPFVIADHLRPRTIGLQVDYQF